MIGEWGRWVEWDDFSCDALDSGSIIGCFDWISWVNLFALS